MSRPLVRTVAILAVVSFSLACPQHREIRSNALEYLYPGGNRAVTPPSDVLLQIPVRVGVAFAPSKPSASDPFTDLQKQALLTRLAEAFRGRKEIESVEVIPTTYLSPGGGFPELDRLSQAMGITLAALVSYNQIQFSETTRSNWAYFTIVGAYVVKGEKNETRTMMDAVVYDLASRTLLFRASGESSLKGSSTPVDVDRQLRQRSEQGFDGALDSLAKNLDVALASFSAQAATGTVHGPGTAAMAMVDASGAPLPSGGGGGGGGGAAGLLEMAGALAVSALALRRRRRA